MHDHPSKAELIEAVRRFLAETARPQLSGHAAFHARVAENVLAIIARELELGEGADQAAKNRLLALLGEDDTATLDALERNLVERIRTGAVDLQTPGLIEHLKASAIDQVSVDQPKYSGLAIATKSRQD